MLTSKPILVSLLLMLATPSTAAFPSEARASHHPPAHVATEDARLKTVFDRDERREEALHPLDRLSNGEPVEPSALALLYTPALDRQQWASARAGLAGLAAIHRAQLSPAQRISYDVFAYNKREEIAFLTPPLLALTAPRPFNHLLGLHMTFPSLMAATGPLPYRSEDDYHRALQIDAAFASVLDNATQRMREGMASGVVETKLTVRIMMAQIDGLLALSVENSPFYSPIKAFPDSVPVAARQPIAQAYADVISLRINPAYRRFRDFLVSDYLPAARGETSLAAMNGGALLYRRLIENETTLPLDPGAVHRLGLSEVARIQHDMEAVKREMGFAGPLRDFFDHIRQDPQYHPHSPQQFADGFAAIGRAVDQQIPHFFAQLPRTPMLIAPLPDYEAQYQAGAIYEPGRADGSKPGVFRFNTYDLPSRFLTGMTTLYLHEGKPGHHFQISLAMEDTSLPLFQRFGGNNAFVEGWALYAETLGYDMGLYHDPWQHWGTLDDEMLRAMRLVVDTGLHSQGWSRNQAIDYMLANSGMGRSDATSEVDRYIADPAQALSYKIGAMTIQRLRRKGEQALGRRFDIRAFHEQVLGSGALPLPVLEAKIDEWIAANKKGA